MLGKSIPDRSHTGPTPTPTRPQIDLLSTPKRSQIDQNPAVALRLIACGSRPKFSNPIYFGPKLRPGKGRWTRRRNTQHLLKKHALGRIWPHLIKLGPGLAHVDSSWQCVERSWRPGRDKYSASAPGILYRVVLKHVRGACPETSAAGSNC